MLKISTEQAGTLFVALLYTGCHKKASHFETEIILEIQGQKAQFKFFLNAEMYVNLTI